MNKTGKSNPLPVSFSSGKSEESAAKQHMVLQHLATYTAMAPAAASCTTSSQKMSVLRVAKAGATHPFGD